MVLDLIVRGQIRKYLIQKTNLNISIVLSKRCPLMLAEKGASPKTSNKCKQVFKMCDAVKPNGLKNISPLLVEILCIFLMFYFGCARQEDKKEEKRKSTTLAAEQVRVGGIYRVPLTNNPATLDPAYVNDWYGESLVHQVFDGLVQFGPYLTVMPALAKTWQVKENGRLYRFILHQSALFHNGRTVTATDAAYSIGRLLRVDPPTAILPHLLKIDGAREYRNHQSDQVKGLTALRDHVLLIRLIEPHAPFLSALAMYQAAIVPKEEVNRPGSEFDQNPVGTGPFRFVSWKENDSIHIQRFSDYYAGSAFLDEIHYRIYPGGQMARILSDFRIGDLEEMPVYGNIRKELAAEKNYQWFHRPSLSLLFYGIRCDHPLLRNPDFRKALSLAIDRENLVQQVYKGQFQAARSILPPGMPAHNRAEKLVAYDMLTAKKYYNKALAGNQESLRRIEIVSGSNSEFARKELSYVRNGWEQLGLQVETKFIADWAKFEAYIKSNVVQIYRYAWTADMPDPEAFLHPLFASDSPVNFGGFYSNEVDQMLINARGIVDPVQRAEMYQQIEKLILQTCPIIPLFYLSIDRVYQPEVQDVKISALGAHTMPLHRIWLKGKSHR